MNKVIHKIESTFPFETKILFAEDTQVTRIIIRKMLYHLGYSNVKEVTDGKEAWEALSEKAASFDLIISDWKMPRISGLELLHRVRHSRFSHLPLILLTSNRTTDQVTDAIKSGASHYLIKPFRIDLLQEKLQQTWKRTHLKPQQQAS